MEKATFGAGCFWGVEKAFRKKEGVSATRVGFMGGHTDNPTYREVCSKSTGHAEVVEVTFDPQKISYEELLEVFWNCHNPTHVNRQGVDIGDQYRTVIFYHSESQKKLAEKSKEDIQEKYDKPVATNIMKASDFFEAEEYHQQYLEKRGQGSCHL